MNSLTNNIEMNGTAEAHSQQVSSSIASSTCEFSPIILLSDIGNNIRDRGIYSITQCFPLIV